MINFIKTNVSKDELFKSYIQAVASLKNKKINTNTINYIEKIINNENIEYNDKYDILEEVFIDLNTMCKWNQNKNNNNGFDGC